jgi:hypothetical protein
VAVEDPRGSAADRDLLRLLVARNALNFQTDRSWVAFVRPEASPAEVLAEIYAARAAATADVPRVSPFARPDRIGVPAPPDRPRRALLVVGSSKPPGESVSERLGGALLDRLAARGWERDTVHVQRAVKLHRGTAPELVEAAQGADLIVLASPVYVDSLPAPVLAGLRHLEEAEWPGPRPALLPLVQCGFPELTHTALALEVLSRFADRAGFGWAGQLAAGGGGTFDGARLDHPNGRAGHQVRALDAAAAELDAGDPVSPGTSATFAVTPLSPAVYRLVADVGWVAQAWRNGALWQLGARPFPLE